MIKKILKPTSVFDMYFTEADDKEDNSVSVKVAPRKNRGTDYSSETDEAPDEPDTGDGGTDYTNNKDNTEKPDTGGDTAKADEAPSKPDTGDGGTDYTADGDDAGGDDGDTGDDTTNDAGGDNANTDDDAGDDGEDGDEAPAEPDTGDGGTDYTADGDDAGGDGGGDDADGDDGDTGGDGGDDTENTEGDDESKKKFHTYKRFLLLYEKITSFTDSLMNIVKDDAFQNAVIKRVHMNLTDLKNNLYDFMCLKYKKASYVEVLLYLETCITAVTLNFELLKNNNIKNETIK